MDSLSFLSSQPNTKTLCASNPSKASNLSKAFPRIMKGAVGGGVREMFDDVGYLSHCMISELIWRTLVEVVQATELKNC